MSDKELIDSHWRYVESILELTYKTAFKHGIKHGREEVEH